MRLITNEGVLSAGALNPTWDEKFPYLVYPGSISRSDDFSGRGTGALAGGTPLPFPVDGTAVWGALTGVANTMTTDLSSGRYFLRTSANATASGAVTDIGNAKQRAMIRFGVVGSASGTRGVGVVLRFVDSSNYIFVVARPDLAALVIQKRVANSASTVASVSITGLVDGNEYALLARADGSLITASLKDITAGSAPVSVSATIADGASNTKAGMYAYTQAGVVYRIYEFYGAAT